MQVADRAARRTPRSLAGTSDRFATCSITEGSFVRLLLQEGESVAAAQAVLAAVATETRHEFWPDDVSYGDVSMNGVVGHRQVTDAYLAGLARTRNGRLASFDQGLAKLHDDIVDLVPVR